MITYNELLGDNSIADIPIAHQQNLDELLKKINIVRTAWGKPMTVTSGYRSDVQQQRINPKSPGSLHKQGFACDISDPDGALRKWILENLALMKETGFWFEDFRYTSGWAHFSIRPPKSGKRIFIPYGGPIPHPELWNGIYPNELN